MKKSFNIDGICYPDEHYMVNLEERLREIKKFVDGQKYFVINRARQYGKTTMLHGLTQAMKEQYLIFSISFEGIGNFAYTDESTFCRKFFGLLYDTMFYGEVSGISDLMKEECHRLSLEESKGADFRGISNYISRLCMESKKPVVLIVDEVDQASNQEVFLEFLGMLRDKYLKRKKRPTFQSVILAGVYDIKNLKLKIRKDSEQQYNSPWNIAAKFSVDMSFSEIDIAGMLQEYEVDHRTGMDIKAVSHYIYEYSSGYPFLVSFICKMIDEGCEDLNDFVHQKWSREGVSSAIKTLLKEPNTLFEDMIKHLTEYPELSHMLQNILFNGWTYPYNIYNREISIGTMFGFIIENDGNVSIANRIFETHLYNYFLSEELSKRQNGKIELPDKNQFVEDGYLNMELVMKKFAEYYSEIYQDYDEKFLEENGRRIFLMYLKPIINGTGNYYIEAQTRNKQRTDIIVDYRGRQYVVEMKIYRGDEYNRKGERQLAGYLDAYQLDKGYLLSFNFNKNKICSVEEMNCGGKTIFEVVV